MNEAVNILPDYTPDYVLDEVEYYFNKIAQGNNDCFTLDNAILLVNMARINNRIDDEQANEIKNSIKKIKENN